MTNTTTFVDRNNRLANTFAAANWGSSRPEGCVPIRSFSASVNMNKFEAYPVGDQHSDNIEAETKFLQHVDGFPQTS